MKLRISGNSLRLRLTESDLDVMRRDGRIECWSGFGPGRRFVYALETSGEIESLVAEFEQDALTVTIPRQWVDEWQHDEEYFEAMQPIDGDQHLHLLVEKDLACAHINGDKNVSDNVTSMATATSWDQST